jgi:hypothetical protein
VNDGGEQLRDGQAFSAGLRRWWGRQSERTLILGAILLLSSASAVLVFVLGEYFGADPSSSLIFLPDDCYPSMHPIAGQHCFSDYGWSIHHGMRANPWDSAPLHWRDVNDYTAAALLPPMIFAVISSWLHAPAAGLIAYLIAMAAAVLYPAFWAARGARGLERVVVFVACGVAAIPGWAAIDRGNAIGFLVPIGLVFLVALCRQRWGVVAIAVILAALLKPQFILLALVFFGARRWREGSSAVAGAVLANVAAYGFWPKEFPAAMIMSVTNALGHGARIDGNPDGAQLDVSFRHGILAIPEYFATGTVDGRLAAEVLARPWSMVGYAVLIAVALSILILGRRIPPVLAGVALLSAVSLFPTVTYRYYLVFAIPIVALVVRDPDGAPGRGIFDRPGAIGGRRRAVFLLIAAAAAVGVAQVPIPLPADYGRGLVPTSALLAPLLWLIACMAIVVSYARTPAMTQLPDAEGSASETGSAPTS